ncbi:MAG: hypothetical protein HY371_03070 [Devosia nanyangense]|nr:hypothetical protein [Devosia nanyangense]CDP50951.1 hypothetical protein [Devosia sp. DBB001]
MTEPSLSPAAMAAMDLLADKPRQAIDPSAYQELAQYDFVMAGPDDAHLTQRGKSFWLRATGKEPS